MQYRTSLDWINFLLADVRGGLGPFVNVFLLTEAGWDQAKIGAVLSISGLIGIALHTPVGALIDAAPMKRGLLIGAVFALAACAIGIASAPILPVVFAADVGMAILGAVFAPTVAAVTLGLVGREALPRHVGRNAAFDRAGNLFIAGLAGAVGGYFGQRAVFFLTPFFGVFAILAILSIPAGAIDNDRARGLEAHDPAKPEAPASWRVLFRNRPFLVLAVATAIFHFANAPMLPLASQKLALSMPGRESAITSAAIIIAQLATIPTALFISQSAHIGRKPLLILAFMAEPIRATLFAMTDEPVWILAAQLLDGVGAGLFDAMLPLVLADVVGGTGRYNMSRGVIGTIQGVGGASSFAFAGLIVSYAGYAAAFATLAVIASVALALIVLAMPETSHRSQQR